MMHENAGDFWCIVENIETTDMEQRRGPKENWGITEGKERRIKLRTPKKPLRMWNKNQKAHVIASPTTVWMNDVPCNRGMALHSNKGATKRKEQKWS
ncbi:MAG: hypothetical protein IPJ20_15175 [Flammeovirgaceae bacterium]|nr:hypothetical protein [Flammeovirgaceae bacterium]